MKNNTYFDNLTKDFHDIFMKSLKEFVAIDSTYSEETKDKDNPFGKGVTEALKYFENLARNDGFEVTNYDNMVVEVLVGNGTKNITIMSHADIVPTGEGWDQNPLEVVEKDGILYGRGVADDKGPLLASYYALKALRDNNLLGDYQVRFLVGGNEESGSLCMEHYFKTLNKPEPTLGFSPDSDFPLIFAEKEITNFKVKKDVDWDFIYTISGGVASNSVIEKCDVDMKYDLEFIKYLTDNNYDVSISTNNEHLYLTFHGVAAHGSVPWEGDNAALKALKAIGEFYHQNDFNHLYKCFSDTKGKGLNVNKYSPEMGDNSLNIGLINYKNKHFEMVVNFRYTNVCDHDLLFLDIERFAYPFKIEILGISPLLYYPKDSVLVNTLYRCYQEETDDMVTPILSTGGGTYAKETSHVIAFGAQFPGWDARMHSVGEQMKKEDLFKCMSIYANAILALGKAINEN